MIQTKKYEKINEAFHCKKSSGNQQFFLKVGKTYLSNQIFESKKNRQL